MSAHHLPLPALFDEDRGSPPVDGQSLAVLGHSGKRVEGVHNPRGVVKHPARWRAEAKAHRGNAFDRSGQKIGELGFIVKSVSRELGSTAFRLMSAAG